MKTTEQLQTEAKVYAVAMGIVLVLAAVAMVVPAVVRYGWPWVGSFVAAWYISSLATGLWRESKERSAQFHEAREAEALAAMLDRDARKETMQ